LSCAGVPPAAPRRRVAPLLLRGLRGRARAAGGTQAVSRGQANMLQRLPDRSATPVAGAARPYSWCVGPVRASVGDPGVQIVKKPRYLIPSVVNSVETGIPAPLLFTTPDIAEPGTRPLERHFAVAHELSGALSIDDTRGIYTHFSYP